MCKKFNNTWAAGRQEASTLLSIRPINQSSLNLDGLLFSSNEKVHLQKKFVFSGQESSKWKKKGLIGLEDFYQDLPRQPIIVAKFHLILGCPP